MRVTVVIPLFEAERYVGHAIDSVLRQSSAVAEVVVVDDGSTDGGASVAATYGPPVRVVHQPHGGSAAARNHGARLATGDLLVFLDADDVLSDDALVRHLMILEAHAEVDGTYGEIAEFVDVDSTIAQPTMRAPRRTAPVRLVSTMVVRRSAFELVGPFDETLRRSEGVDWLARADDRGLTLQPAAGAVVHRRLHGGNNGIREISGLGEYAHTLKRVLDRRRQP